MKRLATLKQVPPGIRNGNQATSYCRRHTMSRKKRKKMMTKKGTRSREYTKPNKTNQNNGRTLCVFGTDLLLLLCSTVTDPRRR